MSGRTLAFDEAGTGPVIVLIHGHPFNRSMWAPQLLALSSQFRVVAPDLPGYGASAARGQKVTMREFAESVLELLDEIAVAEAAVVGLSMGGLIAMELGLRRPERIRAVVLAATTAAPVSEPEAHRRRATADQMERDGMLDVALDMAAKLFGPAARRDPGIVEPVVSMMIRSPPAGAAAALRGRAERPDYSGLLQDLTVPALVIAGDHDPYADESIVAQLVGALPEPEVVRMPGVGHMPNLEAATAFNDAVAGFLSRVVRSRAGSRPG
jgi:3-oxoadipate enol-lactonase